MERPDTLSSRSEANILSLEEQLTAPTKRTAPSLQARLLSEIHKI